MKEISLPAVLILVLLITSCQKIRDDLLPANNSKLYCQSILNPDSAIRVYVGQTTGILNNNASFINDATVMLYSNGLLLDTLTNENDGTYSSDIFPASGGAYTIQVKKDGTLTGSTTVPESTRLIEPKIEFPTGYDVVNQQYYGELTFTIDDNPDMDNYYEAIIFTQSYNFYEKNYTYEYRSDPNYVLVPDKMVQNEGDWDYFPTTLFFSDQLFKGKKQQLTFSVVTGYGIDKGIWISNLKEDGYILLRSISKEYYLYRKYYTRHAYNANIHSDGIRNLLFTGEPLDMYTNIDGGLGVVAAYSSTISKIKRK